jgi:hypothetical protein
MFDPASLLELQTYDPRNPLVGYVYLIILAMIIRVIFIIMPVRRIYKRLTNQGLKEIVFEVIKEVKVERDIRGFIIYEIFLLFVPLTAVFVLRWFLLDTPDAVAWNNLQIAGAVLVGGVWIGKEIWDSYQTRKTLKPFGIHPIKRTQFAPFKKVPWLKIPGVTFSSSESVKTNPTLLTKAWVTRNTLKQMSSWSIEYIDSEDVIDSSEPRDPILTKSDEGKYGIDKQALLASTRDAAIKGLIMAKNTQQKVKEIIRDASGNIVDWSDQEIQKQVHSVTKPNPWGRLASFTLGALMIFGPLYFIYGVLPILS